MTRGEMDPHFAPLPLVPRSGSIFPFAGALGLDACLFYSAFHNRVACETPCRQESGGGHGRQPGKTTRRYYRSLSWARPTRLVVRDGDRRRCFSN